MWLEIIQKFHQKYLMKVKGQKLYAYEYDLELSHESRKHPYTKALQ